MVTITRKTKDLCWKLIDKLPFKLHYLLLFKTIKGHWPNLFHPQDYSDFIFRDNFYGGHNKHAFLADKFEVRFFVKKCGLGHTLTKLIGVWDDAVKIDFDALPNQFAIKCNHSCGMNIVCYDKSKLDIEATRKQLDKWMHSKHPIFYEQHYKHIKPMIICEELIPNNEDGYFPMDFKIHCAKGKPMFIQCCFDRTVDDVGKRVIYNTEWENMHYILNDNHHSNKEVSCPKHLKEMLESAAILSRDLDYARIDFYDTDERIVFGEITLTPMGGWLSYIKQECLDIMGRVIRERKNNH